MIKGVKSGSIIKKDEKNSSLDAIANNVVDYLNMPEAGYIKYGMGYMICQVRYRN